MPDTYGESPGASALREVRHMTATKIMHDRLEWEKRWLDIADHMHAWQSNILLPLMNEIRDRVERRVDRAGWPTRGETVEEC